MTPRPAVRYRIVPSRPEAHLFEVRCTVERPDPQGQCFAMPAWSPGSYLIREYAKHVVSVSARSAGRAVRVRKLDKHTWRADPVDEAIELTYEVYAWDLSVRGAHLDTSHAFFNGPAVFMRAVGHEASAVALDIARPAGARYRAWRVATSMTRKGAPAWGFGAYGAADYDELIDHPVEMGTFLAGRFNAHGVPHDVAITGRVRVDMPRLCRDLKRVCEEHIGFFGRPAPMKRYLFLATAVGEGYGGLEHRASTALLCSRNDLPRPGDEGGERYRRFLGLCSHEYFHTWNVKRIKPASFTPYDLDRENYTTLLWAFEGITSYYDDLALVRCGLLSRKEYLEVLARSITESLRMPGARRQSVAESSFDAWIKYYRQDENAPNAIVSYYGKGSLVALCLDLFIRSRTRGAKSLDDVMRSLWRRHGLTGRGVEEQDIERLAAEVTGLDLRRCFADWVHGTAPLPLERLLATHGIEMQLREAQSSDDKGGKPAKEASKAARASLGVRTRMEGRELVLTHVLEGGAAQEAGLSAGDAIVSVDGLRPGALDALLATRRPGAVLNVQAFRRDELLAFEVRLKRSPRDTCVLAESRAARGGLAGKWLGKR